MKLPVFLSAFHHHILWALILLSAIAVLKHGCLCYSYRGKTLTPRRCEHDLEMKVQLRGKTGKVGMKFNHLVHWPSLYFVISCYGK